MTALETLSAAPIGYEAKDRVAGEPPEFRGLDVPLLVDFLSQHIHGVSTEDGKLVIGVENVAWNTGMVDASRVEQSEVKLVARAATHLAALQKLGVGYLSADAGRLMGELAGDSAFLLNSNPWKKRDVESNKSFKLNLDVALAADPEKLLNTRTEVKKERNRQLRLVALNASLVAGLMISMGIGRFNANAYESETQECPPIPPDGPVVFETFVFAENFLYPEAGLEPPEEGRLNYINYKNRTVSGWYSTPALVHTKVNIGGCKDMWFPPRYGYIFQN